MNKEELSDIESLGKFFKKALKEPKNSDKAGEIYRLVKRLNIVLSR